MTSTKLLAAKGDWMRAKDEDPLYSHAFYLDFQKAFDSVQHKRLLLKLYPPRFCSSQMMPNCTTTSNLTLTSYII